MVYLLFLILSLIFVGPPTMLFFRSNSRTFRMDDSPPSPIAIVFGAGLRRDGTPTTVLRDRVSTASDLYLSGKVTKILLSGDNRCAAYDEPSAMYKYALELGIPAKDLVRDFAGQRTYDTCFRAREIFKIQNALLITQNYHLPRAIFICDVLGINVYGVSSDRHTYRKSVLLFWFLREIPAILKAMLDVWVIKPIPILGEPEPIFTRTDNS